MYLQPNINIINSNMHTWLYSTDNLPGNSTHSSVLTGGLEWRTIGQFTICIHVSFL